MANYNKVVRFALSDAGATAALGVNLTTAEIAAKCDANVVGLDVRGSTDVNGICHDYSGNMYITDAVNHCILKIEEGGGYAGGSTEHVDQQTFLFAGLPGTSGDVLGANQSARFALPRGIACDRSGNIYVADSENNKIKVISGTTVSLLAGSTKGNADGSGSSAKFNNPIGVAVDRSGTVYVVDAGNNSIRKIKNGTVTTIAGNGSAGDVENVQASSLTASFDSPTSVAVDAKGDLYVCDKGNYKIKKITPDGWIYLHSGSGVDGRSLGTQDAPSTYAYTCSYSSLDACEVDESGNLYVLDNGATSRLVKVDYDGRPGVIAEFGDTTSNAILRGVMCTPGQKIIVAISSDEGDMSSSSSESSESSSSSSSESSSSSSSESSSSSSSESSSSSSSA